MTRRGSLYQRFFLPFAGTTALAIFVAWWVATSLLTRALEDRLDIQLEQASAVLAGGAFPLTGDLLARAASLVQAHLALVDASGAVTTTASPRDDGRFPALDTALLLPDPTGPRFTGTVAEGEPLRLLVTPLAPNRDGRHAALVAVASLADVRAAARRAAWWLGLAALGATLVLAGIGHRVASGITEPMQSLTGMAGRIAAGDRRARAPAASGGEIGALTDALNAMAGELEDYERGIADKSRLEALGEMAARVAHEVRNPLTSIKMQLELLAENATTDTHVAPRADRERIDAVIDELRRLELIVAGVLERGRPSAPNRRPATIGEVVHDVATLVQPQLEHRGIRMSVHTGEAPQLSLDTDKVKQVIFNLVNNAADAVGTAGDIHLSVEPHGTTHTAVIVEDSGPGLDASARAALDKSPHATGGSTGGMGLALCRELVGQHGGYLEAGASERLGGARVSAVFPNSADGD